MTYAQLSCNFDPGWRVALGSAGEPLQAVHQFLDAEMAAGRPYLPESELVLRAFKQPLNQVRVLIVGQDPYPTPGHPVGLSFAVGAGVRPLPRSLVNIYAELESDMGYPPSTSGDLSPWSRQGILLLNRVLSVQSGIAGSHRGRGWEQFTDQAVRALVARDKPLVAILWGNDALKLLPLLGTTPVITSAHPSPLSARRGFFGSKPFSRTNALLEQMGADPIDWRLPAA